VAKLGIDTDDLLFTIGTPANGPLKALAFNEKGKPAQGVYAHPVVVSVTDDSPSKPHAVLNCRYLYSSSQKLPTIRFDGHGDTITVTIASMHLNPIHYTRRTALPAGKLANVRLDGSMTLGDGDIWSPIQPKHFPPTDRPVYGRFSTGGKLENVFRVKSAQFAPADPQCIIGADRLVWCLGQSTHAHQGIINRLAADGSIAEMTLPNLGFVTSMATDKSGITWAAVNYSYDFPAYFLTISSSGIVTNVGSFTEPPLGLVDDPLGRGMWFGTKSAYGLVTPSGQVTAYHLIAGRGRGVRFFLGADGNFWVPWVGDRCRLVKFDTNGRVVYSGAMKVDRYTPCPAWLGQYTFDDNKNLYTVDSVHGAVIRITPDGKVSSYGMFHNGPPQGISFKNGKLYVTARATVFSLDPALW
jgi:hypothetical protein